jgi:hypothetical protein
VLDLFVELSTHSAGLLERSKDYLALIARELSSTDLLQRMNVLELLEKVHVLSPCIRRECLLAYSIGCV